MSAAIQDRVIQGLTGLAIPTHMHGGVRGHVEKGRETGGFLTALLTGDLEGAKARADMQNRAAWNDWMVFLADHLPPECHGTPEKVATWREHGGLEGMADGRG